MALLTEAEARAVVERALAASKADACEVSVGSSESGNVRFARNAVSTSGSSANTSLFVRSMFGKRAGGASANTFDADTIARTVTASEELARLAPEMQVDPYGRATAKPYKLTSEGAQLYQVFANDMRWRRGLRIRHASLGNALPRWDRCG